jgi:chromosome segregation ATPase
MRPGAGAGRGARAVAVVDGNPTWDALNSAISAADDLTAEESLRAARPLRGTGMLEEPEELADLAGARGRAAKRDRIAVLSRQLRALKVKRERLIVTIDRNVVLLKRARLGLVELRDAMRGATGPQAQALRTSIERLESFIKRLEASVTEAQGQVGVIDAQIADMEAELEALLS